MMAEPVGEVEDVRKSVWFTDDELRAVHRALIARWVDLDDRDPRGVECARVAALMARVAVTIWDDEVPAR